MDVKQHFNNGRGPGGGGGGGVGGGQEGSPKTAYYVPFLSGRGGPHQRQPLSCTVSIHSCIKCSLGHPSQHDKKAGRCVPVLTGSPATPPPVWSYFDDTDETNA